jgi:hypothetical protein
MLRTPKSDLRRHLGGKEKTVSLDEIEFQGSLN